MKSTRTLLVLATALLITNFAKAQNATFVAGDRSVAIIANPVFGYLGNMFDQNTYNSLNLSSAGLVFRKFTSATRANRFQFNLDLRNSTTDNLNGQYSYTVEYLSFGFEAGKEYRGSFSNLAIYGGWLAGGFVGGYGVTYDYYNPPQAGDYRQVAYNDGDFIGLSGAGFMGTEYYFSPHFFVGVEVILRGGVAYNFPASETSESYAQSGNTIVKTTTTLESEGNFSFDISSNNPVLFFVGIKF